MTTSRRARTSGPGSPSDLPEVPDVSEVAATRKRVTAFAAVVSTLVGIALVVVVQVVLETTTSDSVGEVLRVRADQAVSALQPTGTGAPAPTAASGAVVVYDAAGAVVSGTPPAGLATVYAELSRVQAATDRGVDDAYVVRAQPYVTAAGSSGVVVVSEPTGAYERIESGALWASIAAAVVIALLSTAVAAWAGRRALAPVAVMAATAREWGAHDLDRRFDLGPPTNELRALGRTLDDLLARVQSVILAEQRLTAELAHELRTPLTAVSATASALSSDPELGDDARADLAAIQQACREMAATVTGLLDLARSGASTWTGSVDATAPDLGTLLDELVRRHPARSRITVTTVDQVVATAPAALMDRIVSPLLDNALRWGERVAVRVSRDGDLALVVVTDDGPGFGVTEVEDAFAPGWSGDGGSGLGLALALRVARTTGGDVRARTGVDGGGGVVEVTLPAVR
ncbi:HAMP domain-containing sensor histidine kinase [Nocardioides sp. C4-1]|uniref:sensor histidine kinase n=1 Tax=Nocardioides sp. C4-1 TaxID=3151851 RepID=UPI003265A8A6